MVFAVRQNGITVTVTAYYIYIYIYIRTTHHSTTPIPSPRAGLGFGSPSPSGSWRCTAVASGSNRRSAGAQPSSWSFVFAPRMPGLPHDQAHSCRRSQPGHAKWGAEPRAHRLERPRPPLPLPPLRLDQSEVPRLAQSEQRPPRIIQKPPVTCSRGC